MGVGGWGEGDLLSLTFELYLLRNKEQRLNETQQVIDGLENCVCGIPKLERVSFLLEVKNNVWTGIVIRVLAD